MIVEKRPIQPLYTAGEWRQYLAVEAKRKFSPKEPSLALKPAYSNRPTHWAIRLPALALPGKHFDPREADDDPVAPQILIHKATEWDGVFKAGKSDPAAIKRSNQLLREMVENQDPTKSPVFMDAELEFISAKKALRFSGGHGFRVLAQWNIEADVAREGRLHYLFLGISDDGSCQIVATFPIRLADLPKEDAANTTHLGFSMRPYIEFEKRFTAYRLAAKKWLAANADNATPSLLELDQMISSLVVRKWE